MKIAAANETTNEMIVATAALPLSCRDGQGAGVWHDYCCQICVITVLDIFRKASCRVHTAAYMLRYAPDGVRYPHPAHEHYLAIGESRRVKRAPDQ